MYSSKFSELRIYLTFVCAPSNLMWWLFRTQKLASKARATAKRLKDTGMQHQEARVVLDFNFFQLSSEYSTIHGLFS